jgi:outer membrane protein TolC
MNNHHPLRIVFQPPTPLYFYVSLCISIVFLCNSTYSQAYSQRDSLYRYLIIAAQNNPTVQQKFYEYKASLQKVPQVGSLPDPELNVGVFIQPMELVDGRQNADIKLMQMFPWFGTLKAAKDEMSLMAKAKYESFRDAKLQVFFDVKRSWYELQKVQQNIQISEKNLDILHMIERLTLVKFKAAPAGSNSSPSSESSLIAGSSQNSSGNSQGMQTMGGNSANQAGTNSTQSPPAMQSNSMGSSSGGSGLADLYRIQIEIGELENNVALLKTQRNTIVARFNAYLNRNPEFPVQLPVSLIPDSLGLSLLAVTDSMLSHNPMLGMIQYEQQSLDARKKMVTKMSYPMMGLGLNYTVISKSEMSTSSMNGKDMVMPMATVTLPIYRNKYNAMKSEAELLKSANKQNYQATANSLQTDYYAAVQLFKDGQRRSILYDNQSNLAGKTLDIMLKNFSTSVTPLTDILRVQQQLLEYEFKKIEAVADYNTAISWLQRLMASSPIQEN